MSLPAARCQELGQCPTHQSSLVTHSAAGSVETNNRGQARGGDAAQCTGGPEDFIVTGSGTVQVNSRPAARATDRTMHRGLVVLGSGNVLIGGPTVGATLGGAASGTAACEAAKASRHTPGRNAQSYGNCGLEAWRTAINKGRAAKGLPPVSEDELMQRAIELEAAGNDPINKPWAYGATNVDDRVKILGDQGLEAARGPSDATGIQQAVAEKKAVSASVHPTYWPGATDKNKEWNHEVAVVGVEYGPDGQPAAYIINDTGLGECGKRVSAGDFEGALYPGAPTTVSNGPVW